MTKIPAGIANGGGNLVGSCGATEFVDCCEYTHTDNLPELDVLKSDQLGSVLSMAVTVRIPTTLRPLSGGDKQVEVQAGVLSDVIAALEGTHPGFADRLLDEDGNLRKFVNIFV